MPDLKKAELIDGVVYMPSPVLFDDHARPHVDMGTWLGYYRAFTPGVLAGDNGTVRLNPKNRPQPDLMLIIRAEHGGATTLTDGYVTGPPEHVDAIAASGAHATICTANSGFITRLAFPNMSSGASGIAPSIGSCATSRTTKRSNRRTASIAAECSPAFGLTPTRCWRETWRECSKYCSKAWRRRNTRRFATSCGSEQASKR